MTIEYSCIARGTTILCSHAIGSGSYERAAENVLPTIPTRKDGKTAFTQDSYTFYCLIENGIIYLCVAKPGFSKQQCYAFLTEIKDQFRNGNASMLAVTARDHELDTEFNRNLVKEMESFSRQKNDNINKLQSQVKEVQGVMTQNIEKVIERGDKLDDLIDKTDELEAQAGTFQKTAARIKRKYWWKNTKMKLIIAFVVLVIIIIIVVAILFGTHTIGGGGDSKTTAAPPATTKAPVGR